MDSKGFAQRRNDPQRKRQVYGRVLADITAHPGAPRHMPWRQTDPDGLVDAYQRALELCITLRVALEEIDRD